MDDRVAEILARTHAAKNSHRVMEDRLEMLLGMAAPAQAAHPEQAEGIAAAAALLQRLIAQDGEEKPEGGCQIKPGTAPDRVVSVEDPEMRHGHKSASTALTGTRRR